MVFGFGKLKLTGKAVRANSEVEVEEADVLERARDTPLSGRLPLKTVILAPESVLIMPYGRGCKILPIRRPVPVP